MWEQYVVGIDMPLQEIGETPTATTGIYFLFLGGGLGYVGRSVNIEYRLLQHERAGRRFTHFGCIEVPRNLLPYVEAAYIEAIKPIENSRREFPANEWHEPMVKAIQARWAHVERRKEPHEVIYITPPPLPPRIAERSP